MTILAQHISDTDTIKTYGNNMMQSTTKGVLHFEDLEPMMFERMYLNILDTDDIYEDIRSYGIKGSDEGVDILCSEKGGTHRHFIQCKRYECISKSELFKIVDRIISGNNNYQGHIIKVVTSCDVTKESYEAFQEDVKNGNLINP